MVEFTVTGVDMDNVGVCINGLVVISGACGNKGYLCVFKIRVEFPQKPDCGNPVKIRGIVGNNGFLQNINTSSLVLALIYYSADLIFYPQFCYLTRPAETVFLTKSKVLAWKMLKAM